MVVNNNKIHFGSIRFRDLNKFKIYEDIRYKGKNNINYTITMSKDDILDDVFNTTVTNPHSGSVIAEEEIIINNDDKFMLVTNINTAKKEQENGAGTCLHLSNIIYMIENKLKEIRLMSYGSSVPFHTRLGFKSHNKWGNNIVTNLKSIAADTNPKMKRQAKTANFILERHRDDEIIDNYSNYVIDRYTKTNIALRNKERLKHLIPADNNMRLTREDVMLYKNYYNGLFKKYNIDYEITAYSY